MAKAQGFTCDNPNCSTFQTISGVMGEQLRPSGWLQLTLPTTDQTLKANDLQKDLCSEKCVEKFVRERRLALSGDNPARTTISDPALLNWLDENEVFGHKRGAAVGVHTRFHAAKGVVKDDCLVCQFEADKD